MNRLRYFENNATLVGTLAKTFIDDAKLTLATHTVFRVALSGGTSALLLFEELSRVIYRQAVNWKNVEFYWVDERWVPFESTESNCGNAFRIWLSHIETNVFPIDTSATSPSIGRDNYESLLEAKFESAVPVFDWLLLGAGSDGHTASIFPRDLAKPQSGNVWLTYHPETNQARVGLSPTACSAAKKIILLLVGEGKQRVLNDVRSLDDKLVPIVNVLQNATQAEVFTDIVVS